MHQQITDDSGAVLRIAAPAGVDLRIPWDLPEAATPLFPIDIHPRLPARIQGVVEPLPVLRIAAVRRLTPDGLADGTRLDQFLRFPVARHHDELRPDVHQGLGVLSHDLQQPEGLGKAKGHRFFEIDGLAGRDRILRHPGVPVFRRGDDDAVNVFPAEERAVVGVVGLDRTGALHGLELLPGRVEPGTTEIRKRHHPHRRPPVLPDRRERLDMAGPHAPGSDDADVKGLVSRDGRSSCGTGNRRREGRGDPFVGPGKGEHSGAHGSPGGAGEKVPAGGVGHEASSVWSRWRRRSVPVMPCRSVRRSPSYSMPIQEWKLASSTIRIRRR